MREQYTGLTLRLGKSARLQKLCEELSEASAALSRVLLVYGTAVSLEEQERLMKEAGKELCQVHHLIQECAWTGWESFDAEVRANISALCEKLGVSVPSD